MTQRTPLTLYACTLCLLAFGAASAAEKAPGEDLLARGLELLDAQWRYDQLKTLGRFDVARLREAHLAHLETRFGDNTLASIRGICAAERFPVLRDTVRSKDVFLPETYVYCLKAIAISVKRDGLEDLYINLALQDQGDTEFHFAQQAELLRNNESGRTRARILEAANTGSTTYLSLTGQTRDLPCPLAFDAGFTWGYRTPDKKLPAELTPAEATAITRACYDPSALQITVKGTATAASKAGLLAGAYLGRRARLSAAVR